MKAKTAVQDRRLTAPVRVFMPLTNFFLAADTEKGDPLGGQSFAEELELTAEEYAKAKEYVDLLRRLKCPDCLAEISRLLPHILELHEAPNEPCKGSPHLNRQVGCCWFMLNCRFREKIAPMDLN